jgi:hypothetical protein
MNSSVNDRRVAAINTPQPLRSLHKVSTVLGEGEGSLSCFRV